MVSVVIPYQHTLQDDLRYALRSIERNVSYPHQVVIVGHKPDWIRDVRYIKTLRRSGFKYEKFFDQQKKLHLVAALEEISEDFIWTYDDIIWLRDIPLQDVAKPRALMDMTPLDVQERFAQRRDRWGEVQYLTLQRLKKTGATLYHYETHLPRVYNKKRLLRMFKVHPFDPAYHPATLYFNLQGVKPEIIDVHSDDVKAGFYGLHDHYSMRASNYREIERLCSGKRWLNFNDQGWTEHMKTFLQNTFPEKCRYEAW